MGSGSLVSVAFAIAALGCHADDEPAPILETAGGCPAGAWPREDGTCIPAGLPEDMACPPGEWLREDGACIAAGVPPDECRNGFVHDGDRGCEAILPPEPCAPGLMAVPGESTCHAVATCAPGKWGDIPVEADTSYVDASYPGTDSDGSALKPWTTLERGVTTAPLGAIVAVAAGSYVEDVWIGRAVRIWGVCPALVEIVGPGTDLAAVLVWRESPGTELHSLSVRGNAIGVGVAGASDVLLDRIHIHDTAGRGVDIASASRPTGILRGSLIEKASGDGVRVESAVMTIDTSVIRNTRPDSVGLAGSGVTAQNLLHDERAQLLVRGSLVEQNRELGVYVSGADATVETTVVRDTQPNQQGELGHGVHVQAQPEMGAPGSLLLRTSLVEQSHRVGLYISGDATVEASVIRDTSPTARERFGRGIHVQSDPTSTPASLVLRTSLVERNHEGGISISNGEATITASVVRDTEPNGGGFFGRGVNVQFDPAFDPSATAKLALQSSLLERNRDAAVAAVGAEVMVESSIVRETMRAADGIGRAMNIQAEGTVRASLLARASLVEHSHDVGVAVFGSEATIESCLLRDTKPDAAGLFGDGVMVTSEPASATILATWIEGSARAGISVYGSHAALGGSVLACHAFDLAYENGGSIEDLHGNRCGCPQPMEPCKAVSSGLTAPSPLAPTPPTQD